MTSLSSRDDIDHELAHSNLRTEGSWREPYAIREAEACVKSYYLDRQPSVSRW